MLGEEVARAILEAEIEAVEISLDALTKTTYEKIRRGSNYESVMSNVHRFIKLRNEIKARTKILVSIIDQPEAEAELDEVLNEVADEDADNDSDDENDENDSDDSDDDQENQNENDSSYLSSLNWQDHWVQVIYPLANPIHVNLESSFPY